jgi:hypothetical protein
MDPNNNILTTGGAKAEPVRSVPTGHGDGPASDLAPHKPARCLLAIQRNVRDALGNAPDPTGRTGLLSGDRSVGGLRRACPALSFAKLRCENRAKRPGNSFHADSLQRFCRVFDDRARQVRGVDGTSASEPGADLLRGSAPSGERTFAKAWHILAVISRRWVTNHEPLLEFSRPQPVAIRAR